MDGGDNLKKAVRDHEIDPTTNSADAIARIEREALMERSIGERLSDRITRWIGSMPIVALHIVLFLSWGLINAGFIPGIRPFDPFPYGILTLIVSTEGVFLAIFILISQNRMTRHADRRSQLNLQVNMLAEHEMTAMLRMQQLLCAHFGLKIEEVTPEAGKLMEKTDVEQLIVHLDEKLPDA
jgi:uncharacterized membrane protein